MRRCPPPEDLARDHGRVVDARGSLRSRRSLGPSTRSDPRPVPSPPHHPDPQSPSRRTRTIPASGSSITVTSRRCAACSAGSTVRPRPRPRPSSSRPRSPVSNSTDRRVAPNRSTNASAHTPYPPFPARKNSQGEDRRLVQHRAQDSHRGSRYSRPLHGLPSLPCVCHAGCGADVGGHPHLRLSRGE